ncbi:MAG: hypothetical protein CMJ59_24900 [Planctomycetaceae bacterium]|nr:hypothetical protein [Planctomycetaceae bacterium]
MTKFPSRCDLRPGRVGQTLSTCHLGDQPAGAASLHRRVCESRDGTSSGHLERRRVKYRPSRATALAGTSLPASTVAVASHTVLNIVTSAADYRINGAGRKARRVKTEPTAGSATACERWPCLRVEIGRVMRTAARRQFVTIRACPLPCRWILPVGRGEGVTVWLGDADASHPY